MKTDAQLKSDVEAELAWDAAIDATHVGVAVRNGVVTLSGHLDSHAQKHAAEYAALRVEGVKGVAVELDVRLPASDHRTDADIAAAVESALKWHAQVPEERIRILVEKGWVTLSGEVEWSYQREAAARAVRSLTGVVGMTNQVTLQPQMTPDDISRRIQAALQRQAEREARHIKVKVTDHVVRLEGEVHSWAQRTAVQGAVWSAPGITSVYNDLRVV
jgi:osmotically-inducible protein OsmY